MIEYIVQPEHKNYFFPAHLKDGVEKTHRLYSTTAQAAISVFPDAMIKANGIPNGIAITTPYDKALLLPMVLRDPGCGFLCFKIATNENTPENWQHEIGPILDKLLNIDNLSNDSFVRQLFPESALEASLYEGLQGFDIPENKQACFANQGFPVDKNIVKPSATEAAMLADDWFTLTNTVEIRTIKSVNNKSKLAQHKINNKEYIGFVHSGSHKFPLLLAEKFMRRICDYAYINELCSVESINNGYFGVPLNSDLGAEYYEWLKAAMNYALVSRYGIFRSIKALLEEKLNCEVSMINDRIHAGILETTMNNKRFIRLVRGVQEINIASDKNNHSLGILAGNRETISVLVKNGEAAQDNEVLFSHGTNCLIHKEFNYENFFDKTSIEHHLDDAEKAYYNTKPDMQSCIPLTHNLNLALEHFQKSKMLDPVATLSPFINIYGNPMKKNHGLT